MRIATIENLREAEGYCHQKGIFPAREAVVMDTQTHGIRGVTAEDVFIGNGVSELILMTLEALLEYQRHYESHWERKPEGPVPIFLSMWDMRINTRTIPRTIIESSLRPRQY